MRRIVIAERRADFRDLQHRIEEQSLCLGRGAMPHDVRCGDAKSLHRRSIERIWRRGKRLDVTRDTPAFAEMLLDQELKALKQPPARRPHGVACGDLVDRGTAEGGGRQR